MIKKKYLFISFLILTILLFSWWNYKYNFSSNDLNDNKLSDKNLTYYKIKGPIEFLSPEARLYFREILTENIKEVNKKELLKTYAGLEESDFTNVYNLNSKKDFEILLNNILKRLGLEPHNEEHLDLLLLDLAKPNNQQKESKIESAILELKNGQSAEKRGDVWVVEEYVDSNQECTKYEKFNYEKSACYFTCFNKEECDYLAEKNDNILSETLEEEYESNYNKVSQKNTQNEKEKSFKATEIEMLLNESLDNDTKNILAVYKVLPGEKFILIRGIEDSDILEVKNLIKKVFPNAVSDKHLKQVVFYNDDKDELQAFVNQIDENLEKWGLYINLAFDFDSNKEDFLFTLVHEFSHIFSLNAEQLNLKADQSSCEGYYTDEGCLKPESYLAKFQMKFWKGRDYIEEYEEENYKKNNWDFVTSYAATNPVEDFAESFSSFVFNSKPKQIIEGKDMYHKRAFFWEFPEIIEIRSSIKEELLKVLKED